VTVKFLTLAIVFSLLTAPTIAQAADGILITQRVTSGGVPLTVQVQIEATRMRTEMAGPNGVTNVMIFDGGKQVLYMIDPARKTYMEMTKADVDRLSAQMQAQFEQLPPAQRAQMEAMLKSGGVAAAPSYTRTGSETVGRWTCDKYDMMQNGQKIGDVCTVKPAALDFGATDFEVMRQMAAFYAGMPPQMAGLVPSVSGIDQRGNPDFPVKTVLMFQGNTVTTEVVEAGRQTFPDALFAVPAGFTKQDLMGLMGGRGR
jgi:hypothetical protein